MAVDFFEFQTDFSLLFSLCPDPFLFFSFLFFHFFSFFSSLFSSLFFLFLPFLANPDFDLSSSSRKVPRPLLSFSFLDSLSTASLSRLSFFSFFSLSFPFLSFSRVSLPVSFSFLFLSFSLSFRFLSFLF